jgi:hypothetical protein
VTIGGPISEGSLAVDLIKAEVDQQIATARAFPRSIRASVDAMSSMATLNEDIAEECIYSLPRGGKQIRGPSIRFAEIVANSWGNCRDDARVTYVDRVERYVEAEAMYHDLQTNRATRTHVKRTIELKRGKKTVDNDMIQLAGAAAMSIARRNAILGGVPKPVWSRALEEVQRVIRGDAKTLGERRDKAVAAFNKMGVGTEKILKALEAPSIEDISLDDLVTMTGWRTAINSGDTTLDELFPTPRPAGDLRKTLEDKLDALGAPPKPITDPGAEPPLAPASEEGGARPESEGAPSAHTAQGAPEPIPDAVPGEPWKEGDSLAPPIDRLRPLPPEAAAASQDARLSLTARGDIAASKGAQALKAFIDELDGNDSALVTVAMNKRWRGIAAAAEKS